MTRQIDPLLEDLRAIRAQTRALLDRVTDESAFQWQPDGGRRWSVAQCLEHLNQMNRVYFAAIRSAVAAAPRESRPVTTPLASTWFGRWFTRQMGPGGSKARAPAKSRPLATGTRDEVAGAFLRGLEEIERTIEDAATIDLNRPTFPSPFFRLSRVRAGTGFRILLAHMRRHLRQAEEVADAHS